MGVAAAGIANFAVDKVAVAWVGTSGKVARMRKQSMANETVSNEFTDEERRQMR